MSTSKYGSVAKFQLRASPQLNTDFACVAVNGRSHVLESTEGSHLVRQVIYSKSKKKPRCWVDKSGKSRETESAISQVDKSWGLKFLCSGWFLSSWGVGQY